MTATKITATNDYSDDHEIKNDGLRVDNDVRHECKVP